MQQTFLRLLVIFLAFSYLLSATAVPATRTQNLKWGDTSALPSLVRVDTVKLGNGEVIDVDEEGLIERRIDLETQDYGGTGANKDHDPKSPGN